MTSNGHASTVGRITQLTTNPLGATLVGPQVPGEFIPTTFPGTSDHQLIELARELRDLGARAHGCRDIRATLNELQALGEKAERYLAVLHYREVLHHAEEDARTEDAGT